jgi:hypothetical protein
VWVVGLKIPKFGGRLRVRGTWLRKEQVTGQLPLTGSCDSLRHERYGIALCHQTGSRGLVLLTAYNIPGADLNSELKSRVTVGDILTDPGDSYDANGELLPLVASAWLCDGN